MAKEVTEAVQHKAPVSGDVEAAEGQRAESEDYSGGEGDEEVARTSAEAATLLAGEGGPVASVGPTVGQVLRGLVLTVYLPSLLFGLADGIALPMVPIFARKLQCGETKIGACTAANPAGIDACLAETSSPSTGWFFFCAPCGQIFLSPPFHGRALDRASAPVPTLSHQTAYLGGPPPYREVSW